MDASPLEIVLAGFTAVGLAAACGFRVFLPLLILGLAVRTGHGSVGAEFAWLASTGALVCFGIATGLELLAFYVPVLDNALDALATPAAAIAGAVAATSVFVGLGGLDPWLEWTAGVIAGASIATVVQVPMAAARGASTVTTAGSANFLVASGEWFVSALVAALALLAPIVVPMVVVAIVAGAIQLRRRRAVG